MAGAGRQIALCPAASQTWPLPAADAILVDSLLTRLDRAQLPGVNMTGSGGFVALAMRVAVIILLLACAWYVWTKDPFNNDSVLAAEFCDSIKPGMSAAEILQAASTRGVVAFEAPKSDVLVVGFGNSECTLSLSAGVFSGEASTGPRS